jgi:hypothetical protein
LHNPKLPFGPAQFPQDSGTTRADNAAGTARTRWHVRKNDL